MSVKIMAEVWEFATELSGTHLLMLLAVADHCNDDRIAWPSVERLADKCRLKHRQAQKLLRALRETGYLEVRHSPGRTHTSTYKITPRETWRKGALECTHTEKVHSGDIKRCTPATLKGALASAPEPSLTIKEPSYASEAIPMQVIPPDVHKLYCDLFGDRIRSIYAAQELEGWIEEFGADKTLRALKEAWDRNVRNPRYVEAILRDRGNGKKPAPALQAPGQGRMERW